MNIKEIKTLVNKGYKVHWSNENYQVIKGKNGKFLIHSISNDHYIGLHGLEGTEYENVLNGKEDDFYFNKYDDQNYQILLKNSILYRNSISAAKENRKYLVAVSGDLSEGAMGDKAELIPVNEKDRKIIKQFLMLQCEKSIELCYWIFNKKRSKSLDSCYDKLLLLFDDLCNIGIFSNKWQFRTKWRLITEYELSEYNAEITELETEIKEKETA